MTVFEAFEDITERGICPYQPELIPDSIPIGMFHCGICGTMVLAGLPHFPVAEEVRLDWARVGIRAIFHLRPDDAIGAVEHPDRRRRIRERASV